MAKQEKPVWKGFLPCNSKHMTVWKSQTYRERGKIRDRSGLRGRRRGMKHGGTCRVVKLFCVIL